MPCHAQVRAETSGPTRTQATAPLCGPSWSIRAAAANGCRHGWIGIAVLCCTYTSIGTQSAYVCVCVCAYLHGWASVYKVLSCEEGTESCRARDEASKRRERARDGITCRLVTVARLHLFDCGFNPKIITALALDQQCNERAGTRQPVYL